MDDKCTKGGKMIEVSQIRQYKLQVQHSNVQQHDNSYTGTTYARHSNRFSDSHHSSLLIIGSNHFLQHYNSQIIGNSAKSGASEQLCTQLLRYRHRRSDKIERSSALAQYNNSVHNSENQQMHHIQGLQPVLCNEHDQRVDDTNALTVQRIKSTTPSKDVKLQGTITDSNKQNIHLIQEQQKKHTHMFNHTYPCAGPKKQVQFYLNHQQPTSDQQQQQQYQQQQHPTQHHNTQEDMSQIYSSKIINKVQLINQPQDNKYSQQGMSKSRKHGLNTCKSLKTTKKLKSMTSMNTTIMSILTVQVQNIGQLEPKKIQEISRGANSIVWKVKPHNFDGFVIKKRIPKLSQCHSKQIQILRLLEGHPFIVTLFDAYKVGHHNGYSLELLMEYFPQGDLSNRIYIEGAIDLKKVKIYAYQIFRGINYIHSKNIIHRDIKSENIFLRGNKLVIGDFGSAKIGHSDSSQQNQNVYICSRSERAPELILGNKNYDSKIDIWAAGCVIVEMIIGKKLFINMNRSQDLLIEIFKVLGTPSAGQYRSLNKNYENILKNWKLPTDLTKRPWEKILRQSNLDCKLSALLDRIFEYDPNKRTTALQILADSYFDQIREQQNFGCFKRKYRLEDDFFVFAEDQLPKGYEFLVPEWVNDQLIQ